MFPSFKTTTRSAICSRTARLCVTSHHPRLLFLLQRLKLPQHLRLRNHIECTRRLVRQKKRRMQQHCERNPDALVHAAGERRWIAVPDRLAIRKPHIRKSLERHIFDFSAAFSARHSPRNRGDESAAFLMGAHAFTDLCSDCPVGQSDAPVFWKSYQFLNRTDPQLLFGHARQLLSAKCDLPAGDGTILSHQPQDRSQQGTFSTARLPGDADGFSFFDGKTDVI